MSKRLLIGLVAGIAMLACSGVASACYVCGSGYCLDQAIGSQGWQLCAYTGTGECVVGGHTCINDGSGGEEGPGADPPPRLHSLQRVQPRFHLNVIAPEDMSPWDALQLTKAIYSVTMRFALYR